MAAAAPGAAVEAGTPEELRGAASFIRRRGFRRVCLQFPDALLGASPRVVRELSTLLRPPLPGAHGSREAPESSAAAEAGLSDCNIGEKAVKRAEGAGNGEGRGEDGEGTGGNGEDSVGKVEGKVGNGGPGEGSRRINEGKGATCAPPSSQEPGAEPVTREGSALPEFYVAADSSSQGKGCCVDEVSANHVNADVVIHFGHTCMTPPAKVPAYHVLPRVPLDVDACAKALHGLRRTLEAEAQEGQAQAPSHAPHRRTLVAVFALELAHAMRQVEATLAKASSPQAQASSMQAPSAGAAETPAADGPASFVNGASGSPSTSSSDPMRGRGGAVELVFARLKPRVCEPSGLAAAQGTGEGQGQGSARAAQADPGSKSPCEHCGPGASTEECPAGGCSPAATMAGRKSGRATEGSASECQAAAGRVLCGQGALEWDIDALAQPEDTAFVWVGPETPALTNLALVHNRSAVYRWDASENVLERYDPGTSRTLMRRYYLVEKAKDASIVGIVVSSPGMADIRQAVMRLRTLVTEAGKKAYTIAMSRVAPPKLANFPECDIMVMLACPESVLLDSKEFFAPIITPFEAELAFGQGREWTGVYGFSLDRLSLQEAENEVKRLANGAAQLSLNGPSEAQHQDAEDLEEPRFSLISGSYVTSSRGQAKSQPNQGIKAGAGDVGAGVSSAVARLGPSALVAANGNHGALASELGYAAKAIEVKSGSEFLATKRSYKGLEAPWYMQAAAKDDPGSQWPAQEEVPAGDIVEGRAGRAARYSGEGH